MRLMTNSTLHEEEEEGGPEIPTAQVYCSMVVIALSLGSGLALHKTKFDQATFNKYAVPCEMIALSMEVLLCGFLISAGEAEPELEAQVLSLISMAIVFVGQLVRTYLIRSKVSNFIKFHLYINILVIPYCFRLVYQSLSTPLELETHMTVLVSGLSARLFLNVFILIGFYLQHKDDRIEKPPRGINLSPTTAHDRAILDNFPSPSPSPIFSTLKTVMDTVPSPTTTGTHLTLESFGGGDDQHLEDLPENTEASFSVSVSD